MNKKLTTALKLSALTLALLAAGCGGGGGDDSRGDDGVAVTRDVSGTAAKGIIMGGLVQVFALDAQGNKGSTPVATAKTGNDGTFTVAIPKDVLLFVIEVSATAGAKMADEATGMDIDVPTEMVLRNVVTLDAAAESYTGAVTPLTEMSVKAAEKAGGLTAANVAVAKSRVNTMLGFDPEKVKPINANATDAGTATEEQKTQALMLAAISKMAKDGELGCAAADVTCVVDKVAGSVTVSGDTVTLGADIGGKLETATKAVAADTTINKTGKTTVELPPAIKVPVVVPPVADTNVAAAKAMFKSLRNNLNTFAASGTAIEARVDKVNAAFDKLVEPVDDGLMNWVTVPPQAINYFMAYKAGEVTSTSVAIPEWNESQNCRIYKDANATQPATSASEAVSISCVFDRKTVAYDVSTLPGTRTDVVRVIRIVPDASGIHAYGGRTRKEFWTNGATTRTSDETIGDGISGTITYQPGTSSANYALDGKLPARTDDLGNKLTDHEVWHIATTRTADTTANTKTYAIKGNMTSYLGGQAVGKLQINDGSLYRVNSDDATGDVSYMEARGVVDLVASITASSAGSSATGTVKLNNWKADKNHRMYIPTSVAFEGAITEADKPFFSGSLKFETADVEKFDSNLPHSDDNFLGGTVTLSGSMALPDRPTLEVWLSVSNGKLGQHAVAGQYYDGTARINFDVTRKLGTDSVMVEKAKIASVNGPSVEFTKADLDKAEPNIPVMLNNAKVAVVNLKTGVITYTDNTFESLK